ncbi:stage VI sporulation protein D [Paenibacillus cellulosilyticus]|uniref:Stage VI sporulation protein D n=1 Tax=Paenibacillus cellulosilyticus TaxID=375489 RepID=A0A2V2YJS9_9BACL|nr:LysM peptidoglycan-binding domain-containing protein [Paenibacillus cellulosilyticus]PWV92018.1 stage VI sporulation protein D [Paenibacillus cellulosilyticus]QKS46700.1 LysM peptidoglycan-binding domain-containing protein [Paenibacillus cellulosilyticus]
MTDQTSGLRFDVYERVHLPDDVAAIEELEEIELVPRIQVVQQGEQAVLKGQLLLTGVYRSQNDLQQPQSLEHWIPVEITLPMNRVQSLDDISVEIDHFDVDLLSSRTLNITGILSLHGIAVEHREEVDNAWEEDEPITVVHRREESKPAEPSFQSSFYDSPESVRANDYGQAQFPEEEELEPEPVQSWQQPPFSVPWEQPQSFIRNEAAAPQLQPEPEPYTPVINWSAFASQPVVEQAPEPIYHSSYGRPDEPWAIPSVNDAPVANNAAGEANRNAEGSFGDISPSARPEERPETRQEARQEPANESAEAFVDDDGGFYTPPELQHEQAEQHEQEFTAQRSGSASFFDQAQQAQAAVEAAPQEEADANRKELKVAFGRKRVEEAEPSKEPVGLRTLLQSSRREQEIREAAENSSAGAREKSRVTTGDDIEWKTLFLGKLADEQSFRRVRMCIVQKEETLDDIAVRYGKNTRELSLYNRLQDQSITEGQVIYIP